MIVAIASGKGGTGKTTVATSLAQVAGNDTRLLDCDVEEPDCHLLLPGPRVLWEQVQLPVPTVDLARCDGCGSCSKVCQFHAIAALPTGAIVFPELCHGCGGCVRVCPTEALKEVGRVIGEVEMCRSGRVDVVTGRLAVGEALVPPVIKAVRRHAAGPAMVIVDAPPGTSCPAVTAVHGADVVVLVAEPTAFGLGDLELAMTAVRRLGIPCGVVVNRAGLGDDRVHRYCGAEGVPVLLDIPFSRVIAESCSRGAPLLTAAPYLKSDFERLLGDLFDLTTTGIVGCGR